MLLSYNKSSVSALTASIYQSVEETLYEETRILTSFSIAVCVTNHLSVCMYTIPRDCQ